jgi:two-component system, NarL family, sensor histidine kinase UhpB
MKPWFEPSRWSIASRLLALALVPTALMLVAGNASMYWLAVRDANTEVREHGKSIAAALAEGSRYAVVSGNTASVEQTIRDLMSADPSLISVQVMDAARRPIVTVDSTRAHSRTSVFETSTMSEPLNVDTFDSTNAATSTRRQPGPALGIVRVHMSADPIVQASIARLTAGSALVLLATAISIAIGLALARKLREPLNDVMSALRDVRERIYDVRMRPGASGELAELQTAVVEMAKGLRITHELLEAEVSARTADLNNAMQRLSAADAEKSRLIAHGNDLVEEERRRISIEIHDDLNAVLVSVRMQAEELASAAAEGGQQETHEAATRIVELVDTMYARARSIVRKLRPEIIDALGLSGAAEETVRHFRELDRDCLFQLSLQSLPQVPEAAAIAAYRILQEALSNVVKHANARHCHLSLGPWADQRGLTLSIEDDGRGIDTALGAGQGLGLAGIRERVSALHGTFKLESSPGSGTRLAITLPIEPEASKAAH